MYRKGRGKRYSKLLPMVISEDECRWVRVFYIWFLYFYTVIWVGTY